MNRDQYVSWTGTTQFITTIVFSRAIFTPLLSLGGGMHSHTTWEVVGCWKDGRQEQAAAATRAVNLAYNSAPLGSQKQASVSYIGSSCPFPGLLFPRVSPSAPEKHWPPCPCTPCPCSPPGWRWTAWKEQCCGTRRVVVGSFLLLVSCWVRLWSPSTGQLHFLV